MMTLLQNIVNSGDQGLDVMFMGLKFLIKMTRSQNMKGEEQFLQPGHLYQKFSSHQHQLEYPKRSRLRR